jgi:protein O-mannosyl-transferase
MPSGAKPRGVKPRGAEQRPVRPQSRKSASPKQPGQIGIRPEVLLGAFLLLLTLLAYWPALQGGFVWDDDNHVTRPELQSLHGLGRIWSDLHAASQYYPLLHSAFWLEHRIWGDSVLGYHLLNVALHALSACLLVLILKRLSVPGAWLAGFIFALHPVQTEAVAWISEQKSVLSGAFYLASALAYLHFDRTRRRSHYAFAFALFLCALLSKTVTATLPAVLLVVLWWRRGALSWRRDIVPLLPWFLIGISAGIFTAWVEATVIGARGAEFALTLPQRFLLAGRVLCFYLAKLFWPQNLTFSYPHWAIDPAAWWQYLFPAGILALAAALVLLARRDRAALAGFLIFAGTLFPVLGFLNVYPFRYSYVADHFQYLASIGIIVPVAAALILALSRLSLPKEKAALLPFALIAILAVLTWNQTHIYRSAETLYRETLARNPSSWMAHTNLGNLLVADPDRLPEAIAEFQTALRIHPASAEAHLSLGSALARLPDRMPEALAEFQTTLRMRPDYAEAHFDLGRALAHVPGRLPDAITEYRAALRLRPDLASAHLNLGNALAQTPGGLPDAIAEYRAALRLKPDSAETHFNLGSALAQTPGHVPDAIAEFEAALQINPDLEAARQAIALLKGDQR